MIPYFPPHSQSLPFTREHRLWGLVDSTSSRTSDGGPESHEQNYGRSPYLSPHRAYDPSPHPTATGTTTYNPQLVGPWLSSQDMHRHPHLCSSWLAPLPRPWGPPGCCSPCLWRWSQLQWKQKGPWRWQSRSGEEGSRKELSQLSYDSQARKVWYHPQALGR